MAASPIQATVRDDPGKVIRPDLTIAEAVGFDRFEANVLGVADGRLTGRTEGRVVDSSVKRDVLVAVGVRVALRQVPLFAGRRQHHDGNVLQFRVAGLCDLQGQRRLQAVPQPERLGFRGHQRQNLGIPGDERLDLRKPLLPESLAGARRVVGLDEAERLKLNQIRAYVDANADPFVDPDRDAGPAIRDGEDELLALVPVDDEVFRIRRVPLQARIERSGSSGLRRGEEERRTQQGDKQAYALLYERYSQAVLSFLYRMLGNVEDDIVECFRNGGGVPYSRFPRFHAVMAEDSGLPAVHGGRSLDRAPQWYVDADNRGGARTAGRRGRSNR